MSFEPPPESRQSASWQTVADGRATLLFATKDRPVADYHYHFYRAVASLAADCAKADTRNQFYGLLREELRSHVHGEVDQEGWHLKETLMRRQTNLRRETKAFREYARQALVDTLTLYLHGICCDIDVEPGPRQLPSRYPAQAPDAARGELSRRRRATRFSPKRSIRSAPEDPVSKE